MKLQEISVRSFGNMLLDKGLLANDFEGAAKFFACEKKRPDGGAPLSGLVPPLPPPPVSAPEERQRARVARVESQVEAHELHASPQRDEVLAAAEREAKLQTDGVPLQALSLFEQAFTATPALLEPTEDESLFRLLAALQLTLNAEGALETARELELPAAVSGLVLSGATPRTAAAKEELAKLLLK